MRQSITSRAWPDSEGTGHGLALDAGPAVAGQPLLRQEAALVIHLLRALHPIAETDVGQAEAARARNVIEDDEGAERTRPGVGIEERKDHREAGAAPVGAP